MASKKKTSSKSKKKTPIKTKGKTKPNGDIIYKAIGCAVLVNTAEMFGNNKR